MNLAQLHLAEVLQTPVGRYDELFCQDCYQETLACGVWLQSTASLGLRIADEGSFDDWSLEVTWFHFHGLYHDFISQS